MKINFKSVSERLSDKEMKLVAGGGSGEGDGDRLCFTCWTDMDNCTDGTTTREVCNTLFMEKCMSFICGNCGTVAACPVVIEG